MFIAVEGIDGSGKDTQISLLVQWFTDINLPVLQTAEPSTGPIGCMIKNIFKNKSKIYDDIVVDANSHLFDKHMAILFAADRYDHLYNAETGIILDLNKGTNVVSGRYFMSSYAYHSSNSEDYDFVDSLNKNYIKPDLLIYLDCPVDIAMERINQRKTPKDSYEYAEKLTLVYNNYAKFLTNYREPVLKISATLPVDKIHQLIVNSLSELYYLN